MLIDEITLIPTSGAPMVLSTTPPFVDGARTGALLDSVEIGPPERHIVRDQLLYTAGEAVTPGPWGAREVRITGQLIGGDRDTVNGLAQQLVAACSVRGQDRVTVRYTTDGRELELDCVADRRPVVAPAEAAGIRKFTVELVAPDPTAYDTTVSSGGFGVGSATAVTNAGDIEVWPEIVLTGPTSGTCTAVTLTNTTTGLALALTGLSFGSGATITVSMRPGFEEIAQDGVNLMGKRTAAARFWGLRPGVNGLQVAWTGGTGTATATWRSGWVGF